MAQDTYHRMLEAMEISGFLTGKLGISVIVGPTTLDEDFYNPLNPGFLDKITFEANNLLDSPHAWSRTAYDLAELGGELPTGIGIHTAKSAAQANRLNDAAGRDMSFSINDPNRRPGKMGRAGAIKVGGGIVSVASNQGELNDSIFARLFSRELGLGRAFVLPPSTVEQIADNFSNIFNHVKENVGSSAPVPDRNTLWDQIRAAEAYIKTLQREELDEFQFDSRYEKSHK